MKTVLTLLVLAIAGSVGGWWYVSHKVDDRPQFRTLPVRQGELVISVSATGTVEPLEQIDIGAQIVGRIKSFGPDLNQPGKTIDYGSRVKTGDVLAQIDDSTYLADLDKAKANLRLAQSESKRGRAQLAQAEADFKRAESLRETNSESDFDRAVAQLAMARADVDVSEARIEQAQIALKQAQINLGYTTIQAPIDGVIIDRRVNMGQTVVAGLNAPSLFLMARDLARLQVWAAVNEADIGAIQVGQRVTFKVDAFRDRTFTGTVTQIRLNAGMSNNVVTYGVVVGIDNTDGTLLPYMTSNLQFEVARKSDVLLVPIQALRWAPTREQITPSARDKYTKTADGKTTDGKVSDNATVEVTEPTLWVLAEDGLVKPIVVEAGLTDGSVTEVSAAELRADVQVVVGKLRKSKRDFVSSFVSRVTGKGKE